MEEETPTTEDKKKVKFYCFAGTSVDAVGPIWSQMQELCESWGRCPGLHVPNSLYGLCGREATFEEEEECLIALHNGR